MSGLRLFLLTIVIRAACPASIAMIPWHDARAQREDSGHASMHGRILDESSKAAVKNARVMLSSDGRTVRTDSVGHYSIAGLPAGTIRFLISASGFPPTQLIVDIKAGDDIERTIELDSTVSHAPIRELPAVTAATAAPVNVRLIDFERRRRTGRGQYLTDDDIRKSGAATLQDATRGMRGVTLHCGGSSDVSGGNGCRIQMVRAPMNCQPQYVIDGQVDNMFGPLTPIRDIMALEVYSGPTEVPGEFAGSNAACGVIVVWTRSGPPSRPLSF